MGQQFPFVLLRSRMIINLIIKAVISVCRIFAAQTSKVRVRWKLFKLPVTLENRHEPA